MKAEDTVKRICVCARYDFEPFYSPWDKEHKELHHSYECDAYNEGKSAGIKEVVDWIRDNFYGIGEIGGKPFEGVLIFPDEWQAKLKEWDV